MQDQSITSTPIPLRRLLGTWDVAFFCLVAVFSLRGLATAARMGPGVPVLWLLAVAAFFVPLGLAVAELGTRDPGEGGFYRWTCAAFGPGHGFLAGWLYWVSNVTYLPTLLLFLVGSLAYATGRPEWGEDSSFVVPVALGLLWLAAAANVLGLELGRRVLALGAGATWAAAGLVIVAGVVCAVRFGSATPWTWAAVRAGLADVQTIGYLGTLAFALGGLELIGVMGGEVREPGRTLPRALALAGPAIAGLYVAGTVAVLIALSPAEVSPVSGAAGALQATADRAGWGTLSQVGAGLITLASAAGLYAWLGGVARLPFAAGLDRYVPQSFARLHPRYGTPHVSILVQTGVVTVFLLVSHLGETVRGAYLVLLDTTIVLNFVPFLYLFLSLPRLRPAAPEPGVGRVPGGSIGLWYVTGAGVVTTLLSIVTSVIPPPEVEDAGRFELKVWGGLILFAVVGLGLYRSSTSTRRKQG